MFETMNRAIEHNGLRPVVDRMFPFERAVEALQYLAEGSYFGKICIKF
ncbi:zinc-binding dehydrogenase [Paenibacillus durus]